ncbi:DUF1702 family protein [Actinomadura fulvescens]|uniref:DUF1702 family protein n=1 Tax=Actinomadura fulvescens TaxID=46160 RepID=A0ABN3PQ76_9ACTN
MVNALRTLQRRIVTPDDSATSLETRGFYVKDSTAQELLETIGRMFLVGYAHAVQEPTPAAAAERLDQVPVRFRGFAYEGAAMAYTVVGAMPFTGARRLDTFLAGPGRPHAYMAYIGVGWAMAKLPRFLWPKFDHDPLLQWFVLDGYGFHQAYFKTEKYVHGQYRDPAFPWPGGPHQWYAPQAMDQGIGRAIWFVGGTDADVVTDLIGKFPAARRPDLYAGAGLAATYAGGAGEDELLRFWKAAGDCRPQVAQGSAFAAEARRMAGLATPHTGIATEVFCGLPPERAADVCVQTRPDGPDTGELPAHEVWRRRIADEFVSLGRS